MSFKVHMISWLLLSYPVMDTIAFTTKGTMTLDQEDDENIIQKKPKILKRKIIKKSYDVLTPTVDDYFKPHYPHNPDTNQIKHFPHQYNESLTPNNSLDPDAHITHTHPHSHNLDTHITHAHSHENVILNPPPTITPSMNNNSTTSSTTSTTTNRPRIKRIFGGVFGEGTTALIESALKVSIPIPFCQAPGSPCKRGV